MIADHAAPVRVAMVMFLYLLRHEGRTPQDAECRRVEDVVAQGERRPRT
jgi:hypothetical protein